MNRLFGLLLKKIIFLQYFTPVRSVLAFKNTLLLITLLFNAFSSNAFQADPINKKEVENLKKTNENLWYTDKPNPEKVPDTPTQVGDKKSTKSAERESIAEAINIPEEVAQLLKWTFYILIAAGFLLLIFKGNITLLNFTTNTIVDESFTERTIIENETQLQKIDYLQLIAQAESDKNYRLAIRLFYLFVLKKFTDLTLIKFHIKKTNFDYCQEIINSKYYDSFKNCTHLYNQSWYGEFPVEELKYDRVKGEFNKLLGQI
jgi:hypothetical protein